MKITRLTLDQARAVGAALAHACAYFRDAGLAAARVRIRTQVRAIVDQLGALAHHALAALASLRQLAERLRTTPTAARRPAWQSPYGPAHRR
ncbi:hypothetical protein [Streptomyces sp. NPDC007346]|uniref:hypothetical protein n=1 Tax=Streptomyces sp. NPDC007346 TaxID=3154682 RepID=UPI003453030D